MFPSTCVIPEIVVEDRLTYRDSHFTVADRARSGHFTCEDVLGAA